MAVIVKPWRPTSQNFVQGTFDISNILPESQSGISKFLKRYQARGSSENRHRSGRPRKTDVRDHQKILRCEKLNRRQSLAYVKLMKLMKGSTVSSRTLKKAYTIFFVSHEGKQGSKQFVP